MRRSVSVVALGVFALFAVLGACGPKTPEQGWTPSAAAKTSSMAMTPELRAAYVAAVQGKADGEYLIDSQTGLLKGANPAHRMAMRFDRDGVRVQSSEEDSKAWELGIRLSGYG